MGSLVHTGLGSSSLVAHVLPYPPPPHVNSFVLGPAVINSHSSKSRSNGEEEEKSAGEQGEEEGEEEGEEGETGARGVRRKWRGEREWAWREERERMTRNMNGRLPPPLPRTIATGLSPTLVTYYISDILS
jgi:hypothetical protein